MGQKKPYIYLLTYGVNLGHTISVEIFLLTPPPSNKKSIPTETELLFVVFFWLKRAIRNKT